MERELSKLVAREIRPVSTRANVDGLIPGPIAQAIVIASGELGTMTRGVRIDIFRNGLFVGSGTVEDAWTAGDSQILHQDLAYDAIDGEIVVLVYLSEESEDTEAAAVKV